MTSSHLDNPVLHYGMIQRRHGNGSLCHIVDFGHNWQNVFEKRDTKITNNFDKQE